jgi:hypothetical protein
MRGYRESGLICKHFPGPIADQVIRENIRIREEMRNMVLTDSITPPTTRSSQPSSSSSSSTTPSSSSWFHLSY